MDRQEMDQAEKVARFKRIRRLKKWMRPLPRRSNASLSRAEMVFEDRLRPFLPWSFKGNAIGFRLFGGCDCFFASGRASDVDRFLSAGVRANTLIVALQWISNSFTVAPIYFADYDRAVSLGLLAIDYPRTKHYRPNTNGRTLNLPTWAL